MSDIKMIPASSSWITATGYDPDEETMLIETDTGKTYQYDGISAQEYKAFTEAGSMGRYFHLHFKDLNSMEV